MDHGLELISPILETLEIEVFNILYNPRNIENLSSLIFNYPGNVGKHFFQLPHILEILKNMLFSLLSHILEILEN